MFSLDAQSRKFQDFNFGMEINGAFFYGIFDISLTFYQFVCYLNICTFLKNFNQLINAEIDKSKVLYLNLQKHIFKTREKTIA